MNSAPKVIFFSGVHGAGKGWLINEVKKQLPLSHYSASELIKQEKQIEVDTDKIVIDADENQDILLNALGKLDGENIILLDGHFCLRNAVGFYEVPQRTFEQIELLAVVLVKETASVIQERLANRDGLILSLEDVEKFQDAEIRRAQFLKQTLAFPMISVVSNEVARVTSALALVIEKTETDG